MSAVHLLAAPVDAAASYEAQRAALAGSSTALLPRLVRSPAPRAEVVESSSRWQPTQEAVRWTASSRGEAYAYTVNSQGGGGKNQNAGSAYAWSARLQQYAVTQYEATQGSVDAPSQASEAGSAVKGTLLSVYA
jgi:hypothetical protein